MGSGYSAGVGGACGFGKCNSSSQAGVEAEGEVRGRRPPGSAVESVGLGGSRRAGCGGRRPATPAAAQARARAGAHLCGPPAAARSLAIPSKAPEISVLSACGNVVWRKVARRPRAPAPPPSGPPPPAPAPSFSPPPARAPRRPPFRTVSFAARLPEQTWSCLPGPLGRNLGSWD